MGNEKLVDSPKEAVHLSDANFSEAVKKYGNLVADFWAGWCGPCMMMSPVIDQMAKENEGKIVFSKVNVDENPETPQQFGIMSIPTFLVFKNGVLKGQIVGGMPKAEMLKKITQLLA
jgi:thioredoxin 1